MRFLIICFITIFNFSPPICASDRFADETKIYWVIEVKKGSKSHKYTGAQIDNILMAGISYNPLKVNCSLSLRRESIKYHPSGKNGYSRNEERVESQCQYGDTLIQLETVICAKSLAKNKVGNIYSDKTHLGLTQRKRHFSYKIKCYHK